MPNATVPAAAGGLPTRRRALIALAGLGAAAGLPATSVYTAAASTNPDAALIAFAATVEALARDRHEAFARYCDLSDAYDETKPRRPVAPPTRAKFRTEVDRHPDGGLTIRNAPAPVDHAADLAEARHAAAVKAWQDECDAVSERIGVDAADDRCHQLQGDLRAATVELTAMVPTTTAGVLAKVRAAHALDPRGVGALNDWEHALGWAALRDALRVGGAA